MTITLSLLAPLALWAAPSVQVSSAAPATDAAQASTQTARSPNRESRPYLRRAQHSLERLEGYENGAQDPPAEPGGGCPPIEQASQRQKWFLERRARAHGHYQDLISKLPDVKKALVDALAAGKDGREARLKTHAAEELVQSLDYYRAELEERDRTLVKECAASPPAPAAAPDTSAEEALPEDDGNEAR